MISSLVKEGNPQVITEIVKVLAAFENSEQQFKYFENEFWQVLDEIEKINSPPIISGILSILESFFPSYYYKINVENSSRSYKNLKSLNESMLNTAIKAIQVIIPYEVEITQRCLLILQRLWHEFPKSRERLYDLIKLTLEDISAEGSESFKSKASEFLFEIINSEITENFKDLLESDRIITGLFESTNFKPEDLKTLELESVCPVLPFPLTIVVPARQDYFYEFEVPVPHCLLSFGFWQDYYDISIKLERTDFHEIIYTADRVVCGEKAKIMNFVLKVPGHYKLSFINSYSWIYSKTLKVRTTIFEPVILENKSKAKEVIQVINKSVISPNSSMIGVWFKSNIQVLSQGLSHEIQSMQEIYKIIENLPKENTIVIGIVGAPPIFLPKLSINNLFVCSDSEALALIGTEYFFDFPIVSIVVESGNRVTVAFQDCIYLSKSFNDLVKDQIKSALDVFGPSAVLIAGMVRSDFETLTEELKKMVNDEVLRLCIVKEASNLLMVAAAKLHLFSKKIISRV